MFDRLCFTKKGNELILDFGGDICLERLTSIYDNNDISVNKDKYGILFILYSNLSYEVFVGDMVFLLEQYDNIFGTLNTRFDVIYVGVYGFLDKE